MTPAMSVGPDGDLHLVWMDGSPGNLDILYSQWSRTGWSEPDNLSNNATASLYSSIVVASTGQVHVAWMDGDGSEFDILCSQLAKSKWSTPRNISNVKGIS